MRFPGLFCCALFVAAGGCATHPAPPVTTTPARAQASEVSGVWDGMNQSTIQVGLGAGDMRIEKQEWHLTQAGSNISGYYIAALTFVSGDGRPYVCNRQPQFSATRRFDVSGRVHGGVVEIEELEQQLASQAGRCDPGLRQLARYRGRLDGDVLVLMSGGQRQTLYRIHDPASMESLLAQARPVHPATMQATGNQSVAQSVAQSVQAVTNGGKAEASLPDPSGPMGAMSSGGPPADVSGMWVWEHNGLVAGGDEKQEREEWHVSQDG